MEFVLIIEILQNAGLLALATICMFLLAERFGLVTGDFRHSNLIGLFLGVASAVVVMIPIHGPLGATFDMRAAPILTAGIFAGPVSALVAAAIAAVARYSVGGPAAIGGVASCFLYAVTGIAAARILGLAGRYRIGAVGFAGLAAVGTLAVIPSLFIGQSFEHGSQILARSWHILLFGNLLGVVIFGTMTQRILAFVLEQGREARAKQMAIMARQAASVGIWELNLATDELKLDDVSHRILGTSSDTFVATMAAFHMLIHEDDVDGFDREFEEAVRKRTRFSGHFRIRQPSGEIRYLACTADFVGLNSETAIGVNIDETREHALLVDNALKGMAIDSASCGIVIAKALGDHQIVFVNKYFTKMTGYSAKEVLGTNCRFLNEGLDQADALAEIRRSLATAVPVETTILNRRKDGSEFWNRLQISPIRDDHGKITHFLGIQQDVTEIVQANRTIAAARDQFDAVLGAAPSAILVVDTSQQIVLFNPAAERLFGWPRAAVVGRSIDVLIPPGALAAHGRQAAEFIASPEATTRAMANQRIVRAVRMTGETISVQIALSKYEFLGKVEVVVTVVDMTEVVAATDRLSGLAAQLTEQLEVAKAANEAKSRFLANMSHELRTPLNAVLGFSDMMLTLGPDRFSKERQIEYLTDIKQSGRHLLDLINDILDLARIERDAMPIRIEALDPAALLDGPLSMIAPVAAARGVELVKRIETDRRVLCDDRAARQCLSNLLSNAVKFSPVGTQVEVVVWQADDKIVFAITDSGPGIPAEIVERIGEPFLRAGDPVTAGIQGTGLGLAITARLVREQHGTLRFDNRTAGEGTRATISFPAAADVM